MKGTAKRQLAIMLAVLFMQGMAFSGICENGSSESPLSYLLHLISTLLMDEPVTAVVPHEETVAALREMDIEIPDRAVAEAETFSASYRKELDEMGIKWEELPFEFPTALLMLVGAGEYDDDTGEWTPTSSQVYAFDAEVFDVSHMYRLFLRGVAAIVPGFEPKDVQEIIDEQSTESDDLWPMPEGTTTVSFTLNGKRFEKTLDFYGDWFNDDAITWINEILAAEGFDGQLHSFYDGGQGLILLYGNAEYGEKLRAIIPEPRY